MPIQNVQVNLSCAAEKVAAATTARETQIGSLHSRRRSNLWVIETSDKSGDTLYVWQRKEEGIRRVRTRLSRAETLGYIDKLVRNFNPTATEHHSNLSVADRKPIEVVYGPKSRPCARIERWVLWMQSYQFKVRYQPGPKIIADPLSLAGRREEGNAHRKRKNMCDMYPYRQHQYPVQWRPVR